MSEREKLEQAIIVQESLRGTLDDAIIDATITALKKQLAELEATGRAEQRKLVTVLFMDTVNSTEMVRDLDPEDNLAIMDTAMQRLTVPVEAYGGRVTRYMGDGFKAVFGMSVARENDAIMAVRAGLDILAVAAEYAKEVEKKWGITGFNVRLGINTGFAVIGGQSEGGDAAAGSAINLAARLESSADPGTLLVSYDTYQHIRGVFDLEPRDPIRVKGFPEPVPVYRVERIKDRSFRSWRRGVEGIETRMVGRDMELKALQDAYQAVVNDGKLQIITIVGDAGLGKSRLLYEFENWVDLQPEDVFLFRGQARMETQHLPYGLLRDLFAFRLDIKEDDAAGIVREKIVSGFVEMLGAGETTEMKAHFVGHLLGYDFRDSPHLAVAKSDPRQVQNRSLVYLSEYFQAASSQDPVLVILEDLHWAGDSSLEAVARSGGTLGERPILIIGAARPELYERRPRWFEGRDFHHRLDLQALSVQDGHRLLEEVLQDAEQIPLGVRDLLVSTAEGNPFYVEEIVKMLIEDGILVKKEAGWEVQGDHLTAVRVPPTLTGVLQARLDGLPEEERVVLQQAAVIGRVFWDAAVAYVGRASGGLVAHGVRLWLDALRERELIYRSGVSTFAGAEEHIFKHAILREVTYESVLKRLRRVYHALVAEWLIENSGERAGEITGLIADHLELSGESERAAEYLCQAGEQAAARFANQEAVGYFSRALALTQDARPSMRLKMLLAREDLFDLLADRDMQAQDLAECERLVASLDESDGTSLEVEIALRRTKFAEATSDFAAAITAARKTIDLAQAAKIMQLEAAGYLHWGRVLWKQGEFEAARERLEQALALARSAQASVEEAGSLLNLGNIRAFLGDFVQAQTYYHQALPIYRGLEYRQGEGSVLGNLGNTYGYMGQAEQAILYYEQALAIARDIGDRHNEGAWLGNLAVDYKSQGHIEKSLDYYLRALTIAREIDDRRNETIWLNNLGTAYRVLGQLSQALECHHRALAIARQIGVRWSESRANAYLGKMAADRGVYFEAQSYCQQALTIVREIGDQEGEALVHSVLGQALSGMGHYDEAAAHLQQAIDLQKDLGAPIVAIEFRADLALARLEKGELDLALEQIEIILNYSAENGLAGAEEPSHIYLSCYRVLKANRDQRRQAILIAAHDLLQRWAAGISDETMRRSFLQEVPANRFIVSEYAEIVRVKRK